MENIKNAVEVAEKEFDERYSNCNDLNELEKVRVEFTGKKGKLTEIMGLLRDVAVEFKREAGMKINTLKQKIESAISAKKELLEEQKIKAEIGGSEKVDITMPIDSGVGSLHPRTIVQQQLEDVFKSMGFVVEDGREVVTEYECFDSVNVPATHPARDVQDTFWLSNGEVLKTQTSALQNAILRKYGGHVRAIFPGRCYRNEAIDHSHETTFFQMEGVVVDENVSVSNLIYFMKEMLSKVFGKEIQVRLRPGFFPFTEPSFELDVFCPFCDGEGCSVCKHGSWIELCPCGMIHPNVLKEAGVDSEKYSGFAFGLGLDRLVMIKSKIDDIRWLNSGNLKVLKQFGLDM